MKLCSQSEGTLPSQMIANARSQIMEAPMSPAACIISTTMPDGPGALPAFICEVHEVPNFRGRHYRVTELRKAEYYVPSLLFQKVGDRKQHTFYGKQMSSAKI